MTVHPGTRLGSYEVLAPLGAGGMGEVYLARDPVLDRRIAIKVLHDAAVSGALERFAREARAASALNHPNIVTIHEFALDSDPPFIAMELIEGRNLRALMDDAGALPLRQALDIAGQVADALAVAHARGIVHRDLKPENVMVSEERFVKLLDFGLAKQAFEAEADELTARRESNPTTPGTVMGTVGYMSPEQARGRPVDFRSDQFAFGTLLYEILTGVRPFQRDSWPETLAAIIAEEPAPVGQLNPRVPAPLARVVERCLEKAPDLRYGSTRDLERELRDLREHGSGGELAAGSPPALMPLTRARLLRWAAAIGAALLITTGGVTAWRVRGNAAGGESLLAAESAVAEIRSVAVFPFATLTGDENDALLAAGLSATVGAQLGRIENLQVLTATPAPELARSAAVAARELGARLVLTGTLQRSGDQIRVTYAIVDTRDGKQIAADTLTSIAGDLFGLQDQLAAKIGRALDADRGARPSSSPRLHDPALQTRYLQALGYLQRYENEASVDGAIRHLEALPEDSAAVTAALGNAYLFKFKLTRDPQWADAAIRACERAVALDSDSADVRVTAGQVALLQGRFEEAASQFERALVARPNDPGAVLALAEALSRQQKFDAAEREYRRGVELQPSFWGAHNQLGAFYMARGRYEEAAARFREVRRLTPDNARGLSNLGAASMQMERWDEAIDAFEASLAIAPSASGFANLGTVYYFKGRYSDAAEAYEQAVALTPDRYVLWAFLGDALRWAPGRRGEAGRAFDRAIELAERELVLNPRDGEVRSTLAVCLAKRGRVSEALVQSSRALELLPDDLGVRKNAALVATLNGEETRAAAALTEIVAAGWDRNQITGDPEFAGLVNRGLLK